ncbi:hypothetical protein DFH29DRAFT_883716 [Suillus ampliporus]|nr:hypothetical protein DFH29DRAFT_883716 [Suillus ampliporus]
MAFAGFILNLVAGWFPSKNTTALDFMHCIFLGIIAHLFIAGTIWRDTCFPAVRGQKKKTHQSNAFETLIKLCKVAHSYPNFEGNLRIVSGSLGLFSRYPASVFCGFFTAV